MEIFVVGINYKNCPVEIRERVAFNNIESAYQRLSSIPEINEKMILSTCNRSEIYAVASNFEPASNVLNNLFHTFIHADKSHAHTDGQNKADRGATKSRSEACFPYVAATRRGSNEGMQNYVHLYNNFEKGSLDQYLYTYRGKDAISHLFSVTSGLNSMVLGEPQITGQVKEAYETAIKYNSIGTILHKMVQIGLSVNKEIRSTTEIGTGSVSVSHAAVALAKKILHPLNKRAVLLVGAGKMVKLAAREFATECPRRFAISNRTLERTEEFKSEFNCEVIPFPEIEQKLSLFDVILIGTSSESYIITETMLRAAMKKRQNEPIFVIDISIPRNVEPSSQNLLNLFLYNIDDLNNIIHTNKKKREEELQKAHKIVLSKTDQFFKWLLSLDVARIIEQLNEKLESIRADEVVRCHAKINNNSNINIDSLNFVTEGYKNKLLHTIITKIKSEDDEFIRMRLIESVSIIFDLEDK